MDKRHILGKYGENLACEYLIKMNYKILERNFRCRQGEIDIIAYDNVNKEIVFIEVKTRSSNKFGRPVDAIDKNKINHIIKVLKYYIYLKHLNNILVRIDVIEVFITKKGCKVNHIKQIK